MNKLDEIREALYNARQKHYIERSLHVKQLVVMSPDCYADLMNEAATMNSSIDPSKYTIGGWPFVVDSRNKIEGGFQVYIKD